MELNEDLQGLIERAGELQDRIGDKIAGAHSYCKFCSERGRYCNVVSAEAYEDRERLVEIRDSLKDLETMLVYLQRLRSWQLVNWNAALVRLEESRSSLIEKANQYRGRSLDVIRELEECFGNGGIGFGLGANNDKMKEDAGPPARIRKRRLFGLLIGCIGSLFNPWKWHGAARIAVSMVLASVSVSSTVSLIHGCWQQNSISRRRSLSSVRSKRRIEKDMTLDVFYGRG
ncbi:uncharacterized protein LOC116195941 isoform X2 [Punica granatum]|uniref:Uncharacterized protein LOC116195941 isoform X2 n=1 Tax=Punica granatum TaxID=22663 RepID=A0A6P8CIK7_PUNGR|nr:uncharacterized protein LOC116195941 isoform X2 [Punica granatum]